MKEPLRKVVTHREFLKMCGIATLGAGAMQLVQPARTALAEQFADLYVTGSIGVRISTPADALHVASGKILIGPSNVATPFALSVKGTSVGAGIMIENTTPGTGGNATIYVNDYGGLRFRTNGGNDRMIVDYNGKVGIGTSSPSSLFHLHGSSSPVAITITGGATTPAARVFKATYDQERLDLSSNARYNPPDGGWYLDDTAQYGSYLILRAGMLRFYNFTPGTGARAATELFKVDASGYVLVKGVTAIKSDGVAAQAYYA